jgi:pimeloyl-ACP methyl ester carboxylesterase
MRPADDPRPTVIALHSSGAGGRQWEPYRALIDPAWAWHAPDLLGYDAATPWPLGTTTSLEAEARRIGALIEALHAGAVHLVGHSYGASVALQVALQQPHDVASLTLYEPVRFALLRHADDALWQAIVNAGRRIGALALTGCLHASAQAFVDYWSGEGAWECLSTARQDAVARRMPKVQAEFEALFSDTTTPAAYRALRVPLRVVCGTTSPAPARRVARRLALLCARAELLELSGGDHMAPLAQPERFAALLPCGLQRRARVTA